MFSIVTGSDWFLVKPNTIAVALCILVFIASQLHSNLLVSRSHIEANNIFLKEIWCLFFYHLVEMILL